METEDRAFDGVDYEDSIENALKVASQYFTKFTASRYYYGDLNGEWMIVDDTNIRLVIINLDTRVIDDGYDYYSALENYGDRLLLIK